MTAPPAAVAMIEVLAPVRRGELDRFADIFECHDSELVERRAHRHRPSGTPAPQRERAFASRGTRRLVAVLSALSQRPTARGCGSDTGSAYSDNPTASRASARSA